MLSRIGRIEIDETPDGHCGYWAVGRFLHYLLDQVTRPDRSTMLVRRTRDYVASAIENHIDELILATLFRNDPNLEWKPTRLARAAEEEKTLRRAARAIRAVRSDAATMNPADWFGGEFRLHFLAVAMASKMPVHCLQQGYEKVITALPNGDHKHTPVGEFTPDSDRDFFLYFVNGNHFRSFIPRSAPH